MAAFDRVKSGIPTMDQVLDCIRLGDNVVLQVSRMEEFRFFVEPYVRQAKEDGRNLIYFRFAGHEPLVKEEDAKWYRLVRMAIQNFSKNPVISTVSGLVG